MIITIIDDLDNELTEEELNYIREADLSAREQAMNYGNDFTDREGSMNYVAGTMNYEGDGPMNYVANSAERDYTGRIGDAISAQTRSEEAKDGSNQQIHFGSTPGLPAIPPAISFQTPGHFGSIPAERANWDARLTRDEGISRQPSGHISQEPAVRVPTAWENAT